MASSLIIKELWTYILIYVYGIEKEKWCVHWILSWTGVLFMAETMSRCTNDWMPWMESDFFRGLVLLLVKLSQRMRRHASGPLMHAHCVSVLKPRDGSSGGGNGKASCPGLIIVSLIFVVRSHYPRMRGGNGFYTKAPTHLATRRGYKTPQLLHNGKH